MKIRIGDSQNYETILRVQNMMTFAKEGNQWLVVREFDWNISQPTGWTCNHRLAF